MLWVVRSGDGKTVADIVRRAGGGLTAIEEGRVFVGKRRAARNDEPVRQGDVVRIGTPRAAESAPKVEILFERDGIVACVKPAGLPTVPDLTGASHSLVALVAKALGAKTSDLRVTSRLDRDVSGVVLFARSDDAEERLRSARARGLYHRRYIALAAGSLGLEGVWNAPIGRAADPRRRAIGGPQEKTACTRWRRIACLPNLTISSTQNLSSTAAPRLLRDVALIAVDPITGRTHQIRLHASHANAPLLGDRDYGGSSRITLANGRILSLSRIALHAARVSVAGVTAAAPIPSELTDLWQAMGGDTEAWTEATAAVIDTSA